MIDWDHYTDRFGLIQPMPNTTSGNGLRFTASAILSDKHPDPKKLYAAILNCEQKPGLMQRFPGCLEQETGPDDYVPVLAASHKMDGGALARRIYDFGFSRFRFGFYFNDGFNINANMWRFPAFLPFARFCWSGASGGINASVLAWVIRNAARSDKQDSKALSWHIVNRIRGVNEKIDKEIENWSKQLLVQFGEGAMGEVHSRYFDPAHENHPLSQALKGIIS